MKKFMEIMEKYFVPIAAKLGSQKHLVSIRDGFVAIMPLIIAGSFAVLINAIPGMIDGVSAGFQKLPLDQVTTVRDMVTGWFGPEWNTFGNNIANATNGMMGLVVCFTVAYSLARQYEKDGIACAAVCFASLMMFYARTADVAGNGAILTNFMDAKGLFIALMVSLILGTIFCKLCDAKFLVINMPEGVPPAVARSFAALLPGMIVLALSSVIALLILWVAKIPDAHQALQEALVGPLQSVFKQSLPMILALIFLQQLLWFFGLHGSNIIAPIVNTILFPLTMENVTAVQNGQEATNIFNSQFLDSFVNMGGSGTTICLVLAIFIVSKSKASKSIASLGLAPGLFNINEPILFGMPIVLNVSFLIPFIVVPLVSATIAYLATVSGFMSVVKFQAVWTMPPVLGAFVSTGDIKALLVCLVNVVVGVLIYLPFVLVNDKQQSLAEAEMSL